jgi:UDP-N-acetylmuramoyl-tripeptide--D-alanyl-D-alanine ligase
MSLTERQKRPSALKPSCSGTHNITNLLLASALALHEGITLKEIARRVRAIQPSESRLVKQVTPNGITIINDAYSANPVGARSAIRVLGLHEGGRRLLITPGMIELGELQTSENFKLGEYAVEYVTDVILVGIEQTKPIYDGLLSGNFERERIIQVETLTNAIEWYRTHLVSGDTVLFLNDLPDTY